MPPRTDRSCATVRVDAAVASDARLPRPGTALARKYKGRQVRVLVLADGFEFEGEHYGSLSAVAKAITGTHCNGFRFFKLEGDR